MISVENIYWVIYENLLKPHELDCWYYYPWGTKTHLSLAGEFQSYYRKYHANHVLFHFDQEPLWENNLGDLYDNTMMAWSWKIVRILANSEHSDHKRILLKQRQMLDWYFFYHGFAALDWFRDARYIQHDHDIQHTFLSLNHITNEKRSYRLDLVSRLVEKNIIQKGLVSFHTSVDQILQEIQNPYTLLQPSSINRIQKYLCSRQDLPWNIDKIKIDGNLSARFGNQEYALWQSCFLHVVNETVFYQNKLHLTEKTFKPIVCERPFILAAAPGNLAYLKSYGFQTFEPWIDESYDTINDPDLRLEAVTNEIQKISRLSNPQLHDVYHDMREILQFNKRHFFGEFRTKIVDELLQNFETCIRVWNNARVDGRRLDADIDFRHVRQLLLQ